MDNQLFAAVLTEVAAGEATYKVLDRLGCNRRAFYGWLQQAEAREQYARAKADGLERMVDEITEIADDESIPSDSRRVRIDPRKWLLSKLAPKKYGDKLELAGDSASPLTLVISKSDAKL